MRGIARYYSLIEELSVLNASVFFCLLLFFVGMAFHTQKNQPYARCLLQQYIKPPPPQVHSDITCSHNCIEYEDEEADQDKNWGGVTCKGQGWIVGEYHKGGKNQEDEERGVRMCREWVGEEEVPSPIKIWAE